MVGVIERVSISVSEIYSAPSGEVGYFYFSQAAATFESRFTNRSDGVGDDHR